MTKPASAVTQTSATLERDREPQRRRSQRMQIRIRHDERLRVNSLPCSAAARVRDEPGRGVRDAGSLAWPRTPSTTSGSPRPTRAAPAKAQTRRSKRCPNPPTVVTKRGVVGHPDHGDPERDGEPQRRGSQRMQIRIRHHGSLRVQRVVRLAAGVGQQPGRGVRVGHGPHREHHLPLQDLGDQRGRHEQRLRPDVQNAAERPRRS